MKKVSYKSFLSMCKYSIFFFFYLGFLSRTFTIHRTAGEGEAISLSPLYHFHLLHRHLDISRAITAESSPLHIAIVSERKSLTTKLLTCLEFFLHQSFAVGLKYRQNIFLNKNNAFKRNASLFCFFMFFFVFLKSNTITFCFCLT